MQDINLLPNVDKTAWQHFNSASKLAELQWKELKGAQSGGKEFVQGL